jgi:hypothetical protein
MRWAVMAAAAVISGCAPSGYHYGTWSLTDPGQAFRLSPNNPDQGDPRDPLTWCRPAGFEQRVTTSVCNV